MQILASQRQNSVNNLQTGNVPSPTTLQPVSSTELNQVDSFVPSQDRNETQFIPKNKADREGNLMLGGLAGSVLVGFLTTLALADPGSTLSLSSSLGVAFGGMAIGGATGALLAYSPATR